MSPFTKMLFDLEYKGWKKGVKEGELKGELKGEAKGKAKGEIKGKMEAINQAVKNMLQSGEPEEKIMKYTGISKEELENIKGTLINS